MNTPVRDITENSDYKDRLIKLIPTEIILAYVAIEPFIPADHPLAKWASLVTVIILLGATPFYLKQGMEVKGNKQIGLTMISFIVWIYSLGGPFELWGTALGIDLYVPWLGSIALILCTLLIPIPAEVKK